MSKKFSKNVRSFIKLLKKLGSGREANIERVANEIIHELNSNQEIRDAMQLAVGLPAPANPVSLNYLVYKENQILRELNLSLKVLRDLLSQAGPAPTIGDQHPATWMAQQLRNAVVELRPALQHARSLPRKMKDAEKEKILTRNRRIALGSAIVVADAVAYYFQMMESDVAYESCSKGLDIAAGI